MIKDEGKIDMTTNLKYKLVEIINTYIDRKVTIALLMYHLVLKVCSRVLTTLQKPNRLIIEESILKMMKWYIFIFLGLFLFLMFLGKYQKEESKSKGEFRPLGSTESVEPANKNQKKVSDN